MRKFLAWLFLAMFLTSAIAQDSTSKPSAPKSETHLTYKDIQDFIAAAGSILSGLAAGGAIYVAFRVHRSEKLLAQRQLLLPLWEHMSALAETDPSAPIAVNIIKTVNTLELVALCCEGGMIDEKVILRTFRDGFMHHYEQIARCNTIQGLGKDGRALLRENAAAMAFYKKLELQHMTRDQINPV